MRLDGRTLNMIAAGLCCVAGITTTISALAGRRAGGAGARSAVLSGLLATIGSASWFASAYQDGVDPLDATVPDPRLPDPS